MLSRLSPETRSLLSLSAAAFVVSALLALLAEGTAGGRGGRSLPDRPPRVSLSGTVPEPARAASGYPDVECSRPGRPPRRSPGLGPGHRRNRLRGGQGSHESRLVSLGIGSLPAPAAVLSRARGNGHDRTVGRPASGVGAARFRGETGNPLRRFPIAGRHRPPRAGALPTPGRSGSGSLETVPAVACSSRGPSWPGIWEGSWPAEIRSGSCIR